MKKLLLLLAALLLLSACGTGYSGGRPACVSPHGTPAASVFQVIE